MPALRCRSSGQLRTGDPARACWHSVFRSRHGYHHRAAQEHRAASAGTARGPGDGVSQVVHQLLPVIGERGVVRLPLHRGRRPSDDGERRQYQSHVLTHAVGPGHTPRSPNRIMRMNDTNSQTRYVAVPQEKRGRDVSDQGGTAIPARLCPKAPPSTGVRFEADARMNRWPNARRIGTEVPGRGSSP